MDQAAMQNGKLVMMIMEETLDCYYLVLGLECDNFRVSKPWM